MNPLVLAWLFINTIGFAIVVRWGLRETLDDHRFASRTRLSRAVQYDTKVDVWQEALTTAAFVICIGVGAIYFTPFKPAIGFGLLFVSVILVVMTLLRRIHRREMLRRVGIVKSAREAAK